jgi:hypothetical protein
MSELLEKAIHELGQPIPTWLVLVIAALFIVLWYALQKKAEAQLNKALEDYKFQLKIREQAAKVAELCVLSLEPKKNAERFNQLAWELSLWLPAEIYCDLARCLCKAEGAKNIKDILIDVRKHLLGKKHGNLKAENILHVLPD